MEDGSDPPQVVNIASELEISVDGPSHAEDLSTDIGPGEVTEPTEDILDTLKLLNGAANANGLTNITVTPSQETILNEHEPLIPPEDDDGPPLSTPRSEWESLRTHLKEKINDVDSWLKLVELSEDANDFEQTNTTYEALLEAFPNTPSAQIAYINHVLESSDSKRFSQAATLFNKYLKTSPFLDLWKFYLNYVKKMNSGPNTRDIVRKALEYALNHIGHDKDSTEIWQDYIAFLKAEESNTPWDEGQRMDAIRKAYQRAVQTPIENVKRLWEDYQEFENNLNKITAKKFLSDIQESHMQARTVLNQLQEHLTVLFPPPPPSKSGKPAIWLPRPPTFSAGDKALMGRWRMYLKWEESNPLEIEEKDKSQLHSRLQSVYRKAIVRMRYFSEVWYMAYNWTISLSTDPSLDEKKRKEKREEALNILRSGIEANPSSYVLNFAYAEALESEKKFEEVHNTFKKFLDVLGAKLDAIESGLLSAAISFSSQVLSGAGLDASAVHAEMTSGAFQQSQGSPSNSQSSDGSDQPKKSKDLNDRKNEYGLAWIVYIRFARRAEGVQSARAVFGKARKSKWTPWEVYEAAALMEYHCSKATDVAMRIFEKGIEYFRDDVDFALKYLDFLISINDDANARALFEKTVNTSTIPPEKARPMWDKWAKYEYQFGNLEACHKMEKRMAEIYPNDPPIKRFAARHKYLATDVIAVRDMGFTLVGSQSTNGSSSSQNTPQISQKEPSSQSQGASKRAPSPDHHRRRDESRGGDYGPSSKRPRATSPPRDRERWDSHPSNRRRFDSPAGWDRDRDRDGLRKPEKEEKEEKPVVLPPVLSSFLGMLPQSGTFDGPIFRTDDLLQVFRNAVIPSATAARPKSPPPPPPPQPRGGGRPPPDYSPYTGPGGGRRAGMRY